MTPLNNKMIYLARRAAGIAREDWPRTWKSHAIFASQFPSIEARMEWMRYGNRIDVPTLDGRPVDLPLLSTAHDGVANINSGPGEPLGGGGGLSDENRAKLDQDELRVFDMLVRNFSFQCIEEPIREGLPGKAMIYAFLPRKAGLTRAQFDARYDGEHADLVRRTIAGQDTIRRYGHNHVLGEAPARFPFDAIVEIWFDTPDDAVRALSQGTLAPILDDLATFCAMDQAVVVLTAPCHSWPKDEVLEAKAQAEKA